MQPSCPFGESSTQGLGFVALSMDFREATSMEGTCRRMTMTDVMDTMSSQEQPVAEELKPKRQSLKEIARRVSSVPPMPDSSLRAQLDSVRPVSVSNLPHPASTHPAFHDLAKICEEAETRPDARLSPTVALVAPQPKPVKRSGALPIFGGIAIAAAAIGLSVFVVARSPSASVAPVVAPAAEPAVAAAALPAAIALGTTSVEAAEPRTGVDAPSAERGVNTTLHAQSPAKNAAGQKAEPAATTKEANVDTNEAPAPAADGDLSGAMANAVGAGAAAKQNDATAADAPAAGTIPLTPSQGQVQAAMSNVRGAARGCVADMEEASRASVTFGSNGSVSSVSVSGPAASNPAAAACIRAALKDARVPAFQNPSFSVGLTLRP
jgi:hypothetical protein